MTKLAPQIDSSLGESVDRWLQDVAEQSLVNPVLWCPHGSRTRATAVKGVEQLSVLVSWLPVPGEWAVVERDGEVRRWCQTMRHQDGWVVDAHDGTHRDFAKRVFRGESGSYPKPAGNRPAFDFELWQPLSAASVMWAWIHGSLLEGCSRTMRHMVSRMLDHGCDGQDPERSPRTGVLTKVNPSHEGDGRYLPSVAWATVGTPAYV